MERGDSHINECSVSQILLCVCFLGQTLFVRAGASQCGGFIETGDLPYCHTHPPQEQKAQEAEVSAVSLV